MAAAGGGDVGEDLAAEPGDELGDRRGLRGYLAGATLMVVPPARPSAALPARATIEVKRQHPARGRAGIEDRNRARAGPAGPRAAAGRAWPGRCGRRPARSGRAAYRPARA